MKRHSTAHWSGSGKEGKGHLTTQSTVLNQTQYSYGSRFEEGIGTNPEELIAAAHAGCFTMKLSFVLGAAGFTPETLETKCTVTLDGGVLTHSHLVVRAVVPGCPADVLAASVKEAEVNCPISKSLKCEISAEIV
jgi:osmotically inducible protein OsmC